MFLPIANGRRPDKRCIAGWKVWGAANGQGRRRCKDPTDRGQFTQGRGSIWLRVGLRMRKIANFSGHLIRNVDGELRGCTQTVTIAFDAKHKASVLRVADKKPKSY